VNRLGRVAEVARGIHAEKGARERERWSRERMREHHSSAVDALVRDAAERSPFYRARFAGLIGDGRVELAALPTLDKATLMKNLDDALCDARLRGRDLAARLLDEEPLLGEHRVMASSGSTGTPSLYVYSRTDWTGVLALFFRYGELCGIRPRLPRLRVAAIGAPSLASMTQRIAQSVDIGLHRVLRLAVTDPLPRLVDALNAFSPEALNAYPSIAGLLADEQLAGRLRISPGIVSTSSELCTAETTERIERAFGVRPFNMYATTEGLWGVDCDHHDGIHLFEDWCVVENVDQMGRPVPDGEPGERLLVTNLFNRTLPLIRFEVSDLVAIDPSCCECGRTLRRLHAVRGRLDEVIHLPGARGEPVSVHPTQFSLVAADPAVREFQVVQRGTLLVLRLALRDDAAPSTASRLTHAVAERLGALGVERPVVEAETVGAIERTAAGKLRLVVTGQRAGDPPAAAAPTERRATPTLSPRHP
jgi:phenylacetate-coenzyme A ligase PaaK-like adenylate-forming protein